MKAVLLHRHIGAVLEHLQDRGKGRRTPDAELIHLIDEARLRIARRRQRLVTSELDPVFGGGVRLAHSREQAGGVVSPILDGSYFTSREENGQLNNPPGRP